MVQFGPARTEGRTCSLQQLPRPLEIFLLARGAQLDLHLTPGVQRRTAVGWPGFHLVIGDLQHQLTIGIEESVRRSSRHDLGDWVEALTGAQPFYSLHQRRRQRFRS